MLHRWPSCSSWPPSLPFQRPLCCWHLLGLFQVKSLLLLTLLPPCFLPSSLVTAFCLFLPFQHRSQWLHLPQHMSMIPLHWCFMKTLSKPKMLAIPSCPYKEQCPVMCFRLPTAHPSLIPSSSSFHGCNIPCTTSNVELGFPKPLNCWFSFPSLIWFSYFNWFLCQGSFPASEAPHGPSSSISGHIFPSFPCHGIVFHFFSILLFSMNYLILNFFLPRNLGLDF